MSKPILFICLALVACNSTVKQSVQKDTTKTDTGKYTIAFTSYDRYNLPTLYYVYVPDTNHVRQISERFFNRRNPDVVTFQLYFFNDIKAAKEYYTAVDDSHVSDKVLDEMSKHLIGNFLWLKKDGKTNIYVGPDADTKADF
jgi:hypothetical protein